MVSSNNTKEIENLIKKLDKSQNRQKTKIRELKIIYNNNTQ